MAGVYFRPMSPIENNVDWTVPSTPGSEGVVPSLSRPRKPVEPPKPKRSTLDRLLGDNNLSAYDPAGNDPYNATGRQFRR
jgi:hypothetical protein